MNNYYVYIYWRLDTNDIFYVGKGKGNRWRRVNKTARRHNKHFMNIINKHPVVCEIVKENLTESEALYWEEKIIETLVFEFGYSIDISNNRSKEKGLHLVNQTWGGEGTSGMKPWENKTEEEVEEIKRKIREANKGKNIGKNNGMYEKSYRIFLTKEELEQHDAKLRGKNNGRARSVICLTTKRIFFTSKEGANYYKITRGNIASCCKGRIKYCGKLPNGTTLVWKYLTWNHNKKYRIKK